MIHRISEAGRAVLSLGIIAGITLASAWLAPTHALATPMPSMSLTPATIPLGGQVGISAAGFAANESITVTISGLSAPLSLLKAQPDGLVALTQITVPATITVGSAIVALTPGTHTLTLTGATSALTATAQLALAPAATASPATIPLGGQVTIAGAGFAANEPVVVTISEMAGALATLTAGANGLVAPVAITVPATITVGTATSALSPGTHLLTLTGSASARTASTPVTLAAVATVTPSTSAVGSQIIVSGAGFAANEPVVVTISGMAGTLATLTADNNGIAPQSGVIIPVTLPVGAHTLTLTGQLSQRTASAPLTVTAPTVAATLVVTPTTIDQGGLVTVAGSGFAANETVSITTPGLGAPLASITATAQGQLPPTGLIIPFTLPLGTRTLQAMGVASQRSATASITVVALAPVIQANATTLSPGNTVTVTGQGFAAQEQVTFALNGTALATAPAVVTTTSGAFTATLTVPSGVLRGDNTISAIGSESRASASISVQGVLPVATTLYFAGATTVLPHTAPLTPAAGVYWRLLVAMDLRPAPGVLPTSRLLVSSGTTVKEWGPQLSQQWVHITWQGHDGYLLAGNMRPRGIRITTMSAQASLAILNTNAQSAHTDLTFYYRHGAAPGYASLDVAAHSRGTADLTVLAGPHHVFGLKLSSDRAVTAQLRVRRSGQDGFEMLGVSAPNTTWYLAEGYTGGDFHEALTLVNPGPLASQALLRLLPSAGHAVRLVTVGVPPLSTLVVDVNRLMPAQSVSVIATASQPLVVARTITFGPNGYGITSKPGSNTPATSWIFAQGLTAGRFRTYLSILNPNASGTDITASFYAGTRGSVGSRTAYVPGFTRVTIAINSYPTERRIATVVTSTLPVVVERPMYVSLPGTAEVAASDVFGRNGAGLSWTFPGGDTRAHHEVLYVFNVSPQTAVIVATFYGSDGQVNTWQFSAPPTSQIAIDVNGLALSSTAQHGVTLRATNGVGFVAEQTTADPRDAALYSSQGFAS